MSVAVNPSNAALSVCLFGPLDIRLKGTPVGPLRSRKEQWLFALLVLRNDRSVTREWLAETLWPDIPIQTSLAYLRRAVYMLRQALNEEAYRLCSEGARSLRLDLSGAFVDLFEFDAAIKHSNTDSLRVALDMYRGPLLEGCEEEWLQSERRIRQQNFFDALEQYAEQEGASGNLAGKIACLQRLILIDPLSESTHRSLMKAFADNGDLSAMITTYRDLRLMLRREVNAEPDPATTSLYDELRSGARRPRIDAGISQTPDKSVKAIFRPSLTHRRPLPRPLTRLIGRETEVHDVLTALTHSRIVTLTGTGGIGKTRLAIKVAEMQQAAYGDGVCYVDLTSLSDPHLVPQAVAVSLGYRLSVDTSLINTLMEHLSDKHLLIVLDNCEHLIAACASIVQSLLSACEAVRIMATSQQPLGIMGETIWRTPSLELPPPNDNSLDNASSEQAMQNAGIRLFVERATASCPGFLLTDQNAKFVIQIYRRLDGIPLAIELAAARLTVLSVEQIAAKLDDRFRLLTGGSRTAIPRQQTLRAAMDWSYDLLDDPEKQMLQQLSVFAGGGTLESVEAICANHSILARNTLDLVQNLVDKSFVWTQSGICGLRYRLLETTREYALKKLQTSGMLDTARRSHTEVYLSQLAGAFSELQGDNAPKGRDWLDDEADNVRSMLDWLIRPEATSDDILLCQDAMLKLVHLWHGRSHVGEARHWLERVLKRDKTKTASRGNLLFSTCFIALRQGDIKGAHIHNHEAMSIFTDLNDERGKLQAINVLGKLAEFQADFGTARTFFEQAYIGFQRLGDADAVRSACNNLGNVALNVGDFAAARSYHEQCLEIGQEAHNHTVMAWSLDNLAEVSLAEGDYGTAFARFKDSLALFVMVDFRPGVADCVQGLGEVACCGVNDIRGGRASARLFGMAERMREASGVAVPLADLPNHQRAIQLATEAIGESELEAEWATGREISYDEAIKFAAEYERLN